MTEESATAEEEEEVDPGTGYVFLDVSESGSNTVILDEAALRERGVVMVHVVAGNILLLLASDMKLHKLEEVKGMPSTTASVRAIRATKPE